MDPSDKVVHCASTPFRGGFPFFPRNSLPKKEIGFFRFIGIFLAFIRGESAPFLGQTRVAGQPPPHLGVFVSSVEGKGRIGVFELGEKVKT